MRTPTAELAGYLPESPARVLEVGCGRGELALALRDHGYDVLAIDPEAPEGEPFLRVTLEDLDGVGEFDVVVAQYSLHHLHDLAVAVDKIADLAPRVVVDDFGWDLVDKPTGDWYDARRRELLAAGREPPGPARAEWEEHHAGVHRFEAMRGALARRFVGRRFEPRPYLYRYLGGGDDVEERERAVIEARAIRPLGFRWVGARR